MIAAVVNRNMEAVNEATMTIPEQEHAMFCFIMIAGLSEHVDPITWNKVLGDVIRGRQAAIDAAARRAAVEEQPAQLGPKLVN